MRERRTAKKKGPRDRRRVDMVCAKCGSRRVIPRVGVHDYGQPDDAHLRAHVETHPQALFFKGSVYGRVNARICADCGYTELFTENANELYEAYIKALAEHPELSEDAR